MPSEAKRVNITISEAAHERLRELVDSLYGGNFSRFVADAALFYAGTLSDGGRRNVEAYVVARQRWPHQLPHPLTKSGASVSVLFCSYCGDPHPEQLDSLSADTINLFCPHCGNEQVLKGFRPGSTLIPPASLVQAYRNYFSDTDPAAVDLAKRYFAPHAKAMESFTEERWAEVIAGFDAQLEQLSRARQANEASQANETSTEGD